MSRIILLRHGQSEWNKQNLFTGWIDIPLSPEGIVEAFNAGDEIQNIPIDVIFTSTLIRGIQTAMLAMSRHKGGKIPVMHHQRESKLEEWGKCYNPKAEATLIPTYSAWQLNERMYGELQGMNKQETREKFGNEQVHIWRRSFDVAPPKGESLKMTAERTLPYFRKTIVPYLEAKKNVFVSAHGNSLRSIVMDIENLSKEEVLKLEIPTGKPLYYSYEQQKFKRN